MHPTARQIHPQASALSEALAESVRVAIVANPGLTASWIAEYALHVSSGQMSKYQDPTDRDMLPAHLYSVVERATGNSILWDALEKMRPNHEERHARALSSLTALFAKKQGAAIAVLIQAMSPDSPGGAAVVPSEVKEARPALLELRVLLDELIDSTNEKAGVWIPA